ncbi:hypothetical protein VTP01DRAFT_6745 [Rhizomucor pusillus]|uniref:uncharacterized protein n=1 Tax=Rhizomucor pusillus TaxID=4840 RepID=UPI003742F48F
MNECVKKEHVPSTNAATVGINPATGALAPSLREINFVLGNRERAAYESTKKIERKYENYIILANVVQTFFFIILLSPMTKMFANLSKLPIVTDVTYKALKIGIICTSVMYSPETRKHNVIFQAIMNGSTKTYFEEYFKTLFTALAIDFVDDNSLIL